jgi:membrane protein DedA with SNARE-associated domain/membrane-associated phospholipid phosphatase
LLASITDWILSLHGAAAVAIVFAVPALESSAFVGFVFPGEIAVLLGGVLAYQGRIPLPVAIAAAVLGAFVGDGIGYWIGRLWGRQVLGGFLRRVPLVRTRADEHLDAAEAYLRRRGPHAVVIGRFTAALRVMVPGLAGMAEMPYGRFALFNAIGAFLWGTTFVLLGYAAGAAWERVSKDAGYVGFALLALVLIGLVVARVLKKVREGGERLSDRAAALRPVAWARGRFPRTSAWLAGRVDTTTPRGFLMSVTVVAAALGAWTFGGLAQDVVAHEEAALWDPGMTRFAVAHRTAALTAAMRGVTWLGSNAVLIPLVVAVGAYLLFRARDGRAAVALLLALVGAIVLYDTWKAAIGRARPPVAIHLMHVGGASFPSGHATASAAVYAMLAAIVTRRLTRRPATAAWAVGVAVVLAVGASRVYLGVHWLTDVLAGWSLGAAWACALVAALFVWPAGAAPRKLDAPLTPADPAASSPSVRA